MAITGISAPPSPRNYVWWFPGSPIRVHLDFGVIEGLQELLAVSGHSRAEQGLLFGRTLDGVTEILEFQTAAGRSMPEMLSASSPEPGKRLLVGYYRTESGAMLRPSEEDLSLFQTHFGKPYQVFLAIQPAAFAPANATFFFGRGDHRMSEFPYLEFPLDAALLAAEERERISRCQHASDVAIAHPPAARPEPAEAVKRGGVLAAAILAAGILVAGVWIASPVVRDRSVAVWSGIWKPHPATPPAASSVSAARPRIGLKAKRQDHDLEISWDRESPLAVSATSALMRIEDGPIQRQISLNGHQVRVESILYSPASDQVLIQLEITAPGAFGAESLRVLGNTAASRTQGHAARLPDPIEPQTTSEGIRLVQASRPFASPPVEAGRSSLPPLNEPPVSDTTADRPSLPVASFEAPSTLALPVPAPAPSAASAPQPVRPATMEVPSAAEYRPPVPITKVNPTFPPQLKSLIFKPTVVDVRVTIDKNGKVLKAEPVSTNNVHRYFVAEAVHAAQWWKFQPARRGEEPVQSELVLHFGFSQ